MYSYDKEVRQALRDHPDGLSVNQLAEITGAPNNTLNRLLKNMPDAYIDRWQTNGRKRYLSAVWCVVVPPANSPKPDPIKVVL